MDNNYLSPSGFVKRCGMAEHNFWKRHLEGEYNFIFIHINKCGGTSIEHHLGLPKRMHFTSKDAIKKIGIDKWNEYYTFSLVRHPYSRIVSLYNYRTNTNANRMKYHPVEINEWVRLCFKEKCRFYQWPRVMSLPSVDWLTVDGKIAVDEVLKIEEIDENWERVCSTIGCKYEKIGRHNVTKSEDYKSSVSKLSKKSIKILNEYFEEDFKAFGYEMKRV